jgi:hypothetical protein
MSTKFKPGDKVWVKATIDEIGGSRGEHHLVSVKDDGFGSVSAEDIRPRVKRKSPWQPIETAPRDGAVVLVGWKRSGESTMAFYKNGAWFYEVSRYEIPEPTHWMPIPKLEVE